MRPSVASRWCPSRLFAAAVLTAFAEPAVAQTKVGYDDDIKSIVTGTCATSTCHGGTQAPVMGAGDFATIQPFKEKMAAAVKAKRMPKNTTLDAAKIKLFADWEAQRFPQTRPTVTPPTTPPGGTKPPTPPGGGSKPPPPPPPPSPGNNGGEGPNTPLVLDLAGNGDFTWSPRPVHFDIAADGKPVLLSWPGRGVAFLVLDRNGNGRVDNGTELFGDSTPLLAVEGKRATDGFAALAQYDFNNDGIIDVRDPIFAALRLWVDEDLDGISSDGELRSLSQYDVTSLQTHYETIAGLGQPGQPSLLIGSYYKDAANGREIRILADIYLERL